MSSIFYIEKANITGIFKEFVKMTEKHDEKAQDTDQCPALRFRMNISLETV